MKPAWIPHGPQTDWGWEIISWWETIAAYKWAAARGRKAPPLALCRDCGRLEGHASDCTLAGGP